MSALESCSLPTPTPTPAKAEQVASSIWSGLFLTGSIAAVAFGLNRIPVLQLVNPMILAVFIGICIQSFFSIPATCSKGITFSLQPLLKIAVVFLGLQLSFTQVLGVGLSGLLVIMLTLGSTFFFCIWVGKWLGLDPKLTRLIAAGTSICGASAIVATNSVIRGKDEHVAYSITVVTFFGFLSMLFFPVIARFLQLDPATFGLWAGASIHETAQVIGASFQRGQESGEVGTVAKLSRVLFLVPVIVILGFSSGERAQGPAHPGRRRFPIPWFVIGFVALVTVNSLFILEPAIQEVIKVANKFLLTVALAAMGLRMSFSQMRKTGLRPLCLGVASWVYVSIVGLLLAKTLV